MKISYRIALITYLVPLLLYAISLVSAIAAMGSPVSDALATAYMTVIVGLLAQFITGAVHVIITIFLYINYTRLSERARGALNAYVVIAVLCIALLIFLAANEIFSEEEPMVLALIIGPMLVGGAFTCLMYRLRNLDLNQTNQKTVL